VYWLDLKLVAISMLLIALAIGGIVNIGWQTQQKHPGAYTSSEAQSIAVDSRIPF
jgi:hypothetical protein